MPLIIPVEGVSARQLERQLGQSRGGGARAHHAIDILAPRGTPVLAAASGTVEKIFESVNGGRHTVYVRTRDGAAIHYCAHLDSWLVGERQAVRQGERIATVGNTGSAAGGAPHLHFEIKRMLPGEELVAGENINPYPLLRDGRSSSPSCGWKPRISRRKGTACGTRPRLPRAAAWLAEGGARGKGARSALSQFHRSRP